MSFRGVDKGGGERPAKANIPGSVLVIGAGGLGSAVIPALAKAGISRIGIADFDDVELSNLGRQIIHRTCDVGRPKTVSAAEKVRETDPSIEVVLHGRMTPGNIAGTVEQYDFIVDATDGFENKFLINDGCVKAGKPFVHGGVVKTGGQVMTCVPGRTPCLRCVLGDVPPAWESPSGGRVGILGAAAGVIGSAEALEAVKFLTGEGELLAGRIMIFDGSTGSIRTAGLGRRDPLCAACGEGSSE